MEFISQGILPGSWIIHINCSALTNGFQGNGAVARLQAATRKIMCHQAVGFRAYQPVGRIAAPEIGTIHLKESSRGLAEKPDQGWGLSSLCGRFRESQQQFLESIVRTRAGFFQHYRVSGMQGQKSTA